MTEQITNQELKWGYWYLVHRARLRRVGLTVLGLFGFGLLIYAGWHWIDWLTSRQAEEDSLRVLVSTSVNVAEYRKRNSPLPLEVGVVTATPAGAGAYDLVAQVKNPNLRWGVRELNFTFLAGGQVFSGRSFVLPLDEQYLIIEDVSLSAAPKDLQISLGEGGWMRIRELDKFVVPTFDVSDQKLEPSESLDGTTAGTRLSFKLTNTSAYSFWQVDAAVVLTRNTIIQTVAHQGIGSMNSGEEREVKLFWKGNVGGADNLVVKPEVNVLELSVFKPL